jgi:hypothetical protein
MRSKAGILSAKNSMAKSTAEAAITHQLASKCRPCRQVQQTGVGQQAQRGYCGIDIEAGGEAYGNNQAR